MPTDTSNSTQIPRPRVALVTGASRGLGRSMALHLADRGVGIIGTYLSNEDEAHDAAREIESRGVKAALLRLDTGAAGTFEAFADGVREVLGETFGVERLHALVNNAGYGFNTPFTETKEDAFDRIVAVQYKGPYFLTQRLLSLIEDGGRILFVSSGLTRFAISGYSAYASTKSAIEVVARYLAKELGDRQIRVNVVAPGVVETDFAGGIVRDNPDLNTELAETIALGRVGLPDDIGAAVATILSDDFGWVTGQRIEVSGGQNL